MLGKLLVPFSLLGIGALLAAALVFAGARPAQEALEGVIHVNVTGLRNEKGQIVCSLFSSAADFPKKMEKAIAQVKAKISRGAAACEFSGIASGTYAVSVFHDQNSNGKLDSNFLGIPREGVGASNDAKGRFGPPKFAAAAFQFSGGRIELKIPIHYL